MSEPSRFWDKIAKKYAASPIKDMDAYHQTLDRARVYLSADDRALEVGCGTGTTALLLAGDVKHMTATDISTAMIDIGRSKAADQAVSNVAFKPGTIEQAQREGDVYDAVLAFNFLHLVESLPAALKGVRALTKPGGVFISKTPCLGERTFLFRPLIAVMRAVGKAPYVSFLRYDSLEAAVRDAGFEILETGNYPAASSSRFIAARRLET